jgi:RNA polymerase sigma factor for flagellar operon FliA
MSLLSETIGKREETMTNQRGDAELLRRFVATRDPSLREEIILSYIPLVHYNLGRLGLSQSQGADYEDAASQGLIGLIEAVDNYDPRFGTQFSTYATVRVRGRVLDYLRALDWLSRTARRRARAVQQAITDLWGVLQRAPTEDELAKYLQYDLPTLQQALLDSRHVILSLDSTVQAEGESEGSFHELLPDEDQIDPADALDDEESRSQLVKTIKSLPERQQLLLSLYYNENLTFKEIGEMLGVSESRVCQLHARAMLELRGMLLPYSNDLAWGPGTAANPPVMVPQPQRESYGFQGR